MGRKNCYYGIYINYNMNKTSIQAHPFHLVEVSPWPLTASLLLLTMTSVAGLSMIFSLIQPDIVELFNTSILLLNTVPIMIYHNADVNKLQILSENKEKAGIYMWTQNESGKRCVGSAVDLSKRLSNYYSIAYLTRFKSMYINNALLHHGYSEFSLSILEFIDITNLSKEDASKLILEREQHFLDSLSPEPLGGSIPWGAVLNIYI
jgi:GIY-YIG catalytic domain